MWQACGGTCWPRQVHAMPAKEGLATSPVTTLLPAGCGATCAAPLLQVNKNLLLKARLGMDTLAAGIAVKSWWAPSITLALHGGWNVNKGCPLLGCHVHVENFGNLR